MTVTSAAQLNAKLRAGATAVETAHVTGVFEAALAAKATMLAHGAAAGVGPGSKVAKGKTGVSFNVRGRVNPTALVRWYGPVHLVNSPTKAHSIVPKTRRRGRAARALAIPGSPNGFAASANHPGTKGKDFFSGAQTQIEAQSPQIIARAVRTALRRVFTG